MRNHGFVLTNEGRCLSPLYDVNPNSEGDVLSLNVDENNTLIDFELALDVASTFGITEKQAKIHLDEIWNLRDRSLYTYRNEIRSYL